MVERLISFSGIFVLLGIAWLMSNNRKKIHFRTVWVGISLQLIFAVFILKTRVGLMVFDFSRVVITKLLDFTDYGSVFLFGNLYRATPDIVKGLGSSGPYQLMNSATGRFVNIGTIFAIHVLPTIIFFASIMSILYHLGIMQKFVAAMAWVISRAMKVSGAESLSAASNIFVGQTEAPLVIKPYISDMTMSELMAVMVGGFATVAGGIMAAYVRFGIDPGNLMAASVMSAPASLVMAKIIYPETKTPKTAETVKVFIEKKTENVIDAAAQGAAEGLKLALNVGAMLLAFIAIIAMINFGLGFLHTSLKEIFGYIFMPISFFMGVPTKDLVEFGNLLGTKISVNEFVAYVELGAIKDQLSPRTVIIATYALCGFANFSSIAIQIGGIGGIAPNRRSDLAKLGMRAMFGGALASWLTATIAGMII
ncbi:nucleoside permease NupX [bacterium BMS3Abin05]|nr:nucleoside permease NupX [bacterium BMS3Abin05]GBE28455.1 nucleoside permease NupX [bacterium BMS3Bbin03]HDZ12158.1 NupC/NupG family nucleoside CNT transporter [Bacteroidota bacterium]